MPAPERAMLLRSKRKVNFRFEREMFLRSERKMNFRSERDEP